ncbi:MAG: hypothetical protein P1S60_19870 [Anaerolineae bacterium]|nr:hypothetical protein [Anaerolineae bacterium]
MPNTSQKLKINRNFVALIGDYFFFAIGVAFIDPLVVVPAFVKEFTGSEFMVGVLSALRTFMVTVPQLWAASILVAQPRKKSVLIASSIIGRLPIAVLAVAVIGWVDTNLKWVIAILAITVAVFYTSEGFNGVSWPVLVGKVLPENSRGRFFGLGQLLSSLGAAVAGYSVNQIMALPGQPLKARWAIIFAAGFVILMFSVFSMTFISEKPDQTYHQRANVSESLKMMVKYLRADSNLRRIVIVQLILYTAGSVSPFFILRAREILPAADAKIGTFITLQSVGGAVAAVASGYLVDQVGSWAAIRLGAVVKVLMLLVVSLAGLTAFRLLLYGISFFLLGYINSSSWWSFSAYLLDMASDEQRPIYLAASGILTSILVLNPLIAGILYASLFPETMFVGAFILAIIGLFLAWTLKKTMPAGSMPAENMPG